MLHSYLANNKTTTYHGESHDAQAEKANLQGLFLREVLP